MKFRRAPVIFPALVLALLVAGLAMTGGARISAVIRADGPQVSSPVVQLPADKGLYVLHVDLLVDPNLQGDLAVSLEGRPGMNYSLYQPQEWIFGEGLPQSGVRGQLLSRKNPENRLRFWMVLQPKPPVRFEPDDATAIPPCCSAAGNLDHSSLAVATDWGKSLRLMIREAAGRRELLSIPIVCGDLTAVEIQNSSDQIEDLSQLFIKPPPKSKP